VLENALGTFWQFVQATSDGHEAQLQLFQIKAKLTPENNQQQLHLNSKVLSRSCHNSNQNHDNACNVPRI